MTPSRTPETFIRKDRVVRGIDAPRSGVGAPPAEQGHEIVVSDASIADGSARTLPPLVDRPGTIAPVRVAVFPAAGLGTRMVPASKAIPKEMLTVVDRPVIQYGVEEAAASGIE